MAAEAGIVFVHERGASGFKHLPETMGAGVAWLDYDRDGRVDLYVVQSGPFPPENVASAGNRLFRNLGHGRFEDQTSASGGGHRGYGQGVTAADVNGDGWEDLYICNFGPDALLINRGDGTFTDMTREAGLGLDGWSSSAAFADADGDGDLDLYVTRYVEYDPPSGFFCVDPATDERRYCDPTFFVGAQDRFYLNRGDGTFEDVTDSAGLRDAKGRGLGVLFTDLDGDGDPDLYVSNDLTINFLFANRGDGTFEDVSLFSGAGLNRRGKAEAGMGLAVADFDGDLAPDLMVTNFDVETNSIYSNRGDLSFDDVSAMSGFGIPSFNRLGFGLVATDLDLDGHTDVYVANGHIFERPNRDSVDYAQEDLLLIGDDKGKFRSVRCGEVFDSRYVGRGLAAADYDDDGDMDLAVSNSGGPLQLLQNSRNGGEWIGFQLEGDLPNRAAVGARVVLHGTGRDQIRWITAGDSYQSSSDKRVVFGLPQADGQGLEVDVRWPGGASTTFRDIAAGRYWRLRQAEAKAEPLGSGDDTAAPVAMNESSGIFGGAKLIVAAVVAAGLLIGISLRNMFFRQRKHSEDQRE